jgi:hypothetical protein
MVMAVPGGLDPANVTSQFSDNERLDSERIDLTARRSR